MAEVDTSNLPPPPLTPPDDWDSQAYNKKRGNQGAIPESYLADINGPDGPTKHLGKHLPYFPDLDPSLIPTGYVALMWGDPKMGYAQHPNSLKGSNAYPRGHWYNWVRLRKATDGQAEELESRFSNWPEPGADDNGRFAVKGEGDIEDNVGKNTVYLVALPADVTEGDKIRIHSHCLYHGEYVDFLTL